MDTDIQNLVLNIVRQNVANRELFTAHDVTRTVRTQTKKNVRHAEAKEVVHEEMQNSLSSGSYLRDLIDVGKPEMPFLYYPAGEDPGNYTGHQVGRFATIASMAAAALPPSDSSRTQDNRGRIAVPASLIRDLGLRHTNTAYVLAEQNKLTVFASEPPNYTASYYVDISDNIRISGVVINQAGLDQKTYDFSVINGTIEITES